MKLCVLGSGSRGNAVLMQSGDTRILIDAGFAPRSMAQRLAMIGVDPRSIEAVVLTHEHWDHARGAFGGAAKWGWQIYATAGTKGACLPLVDVDVRTLAAGSDIDVGHFQLTAVRTSHDACDPIGIVATGRSSGVRAAIVYDLGITTDAVRKAVERVDILVLESNHDPEMLRNGPYPAMLKRRIAGREGHLSNRAAAMTAADCAHGGMSTVVLAHLSEVNNTPGAAMQTMQAALRRTSFKGSVVATTQDVPSPTVGAKRAAAFGPVQLSLAI